MIRFARIREITFGPDKDVALGWIAADTALSVIPLTDDTGAFHFGNGTKDLDVKAFLGSTGEFVLFDVGNSRVEMARVPLYWSGTLTGKGLNFNDAVFPAGSSNNILSFGDGAGAKTISISDYHFLIRLNVVNNANPSAGRLFSWLFLKFAQSTVHQANLDLQGMGLTVELSKNIGYAHILDTYLNIVETLTVTSDVHCAKFKINTASGKTVTATKFSPLLCEVTGAGTITLGAANLSSFLELITSSSAALDAGINFNPLAGTSITSVFKIGGAVTGLITNLFNFARDGGSAAVKITGAYTDGSQDSDGLIRCVVNGVAYFIPVFAAGKVTGEW